MESSGSFKIVNALEWRSFYLSGSFQLCSRD